MGTTNVFRRCRGFTLVELLIVIIIIAVLAAIAIPKFSNSSIRSKESSLKADLMLYRNAIESYKNDTGADPNTLSDLTATTAPATGLNPTTGVSASITASNWRGPYMLAQQNDPVSGNALNYSTTAGTVGNVTSSATGTASDGTLYSTW